MASRYPGLRDQTLLPENVARSKHRQRKIPKQAHHGRWTNRLRWVGKPKHTSSRNNPCGEWLLPGFGRRVGR